MTTHPHLFTDPSDHPHLFTDPSDAATFTLAGKAKLTLVSKKTEARFTFKVERVLNRETGEPEDRWFVSVLNGPDNWANYAYAGLLKEGGKTFTHTKGSKVAADSPSFKAFDFFAKTVLHGHLPTTLEVWHSGSCGKCGKLLTVPESIRRGIGPECFTNMGL